MNNDPKAFLFYEDSIAKARQKQIKYDNTIINSYKLQIIKITLFS